MERLEQLRCPNWRMRGQSTLIVWHCTSCSSGDTREPLSANPMTPLSLAGFAIEFPKSCRRIACTFHPGKHLVVPANGVGSARGRGCRDGHPAFLASAAPVRYVGVLTKCQGADGAEGVRYRSQPTRLADRSGTATREGVAEMTLSSGVVVIMRRGPAEPPTHVPMRVRAKGGIIASPRGRGCARLS